MGFRSVTEIICRSRGEMTTTILLPRALALLVLSFAFMALPQTAKAQFSIQSPVVEKGEVEIENHSSFQFGLPGEMRAPVNRRMRCRSVTASPISGRASLV